MTAHDQPLRGTVDLAKFDVDWNAVFRQELPRIYNYLRYRLGDNALAEDLTSATFEKAWRARTGYKSDLAAFSTWLLTIARNTATDYLRAHRPTLELDALLDYPAPDSPHEAYTRKTQLEQLAALLGQLAEHERDLAALKYGAELNNREIADHLGMSESNVGTSLYRIVGKLRQAWKESNGD